MSHYYINDDTLSKETKTMEVIIKGNNYKFLTMSGVFSKDGLDYGTKILLNNLNKAKNVTKIADVGCGYGPIGISLAKENPKSTVYMYDINERAVELATTNANLNNITNVVTKVNDSLDDVSKDFELIVTNPPIRAGKKVVFKIYEQAYERLVDGGELFVVIQRKQGAPTSFQKIMDLFGNATKVAQVSGYWVISAKKGL